MVTAASVRPAYESWRLFHQLFRYDYLSFIGEASGKGYIDNVDQKPDLISRSLLEDMESIDRNGVMLKSRASRSSLPLCHALCSVMGRPCMSLWWDLKGLLLLHRKRQCPPNGRPSLVCVAVIKQSHNKRLGEMMVFTHNPRLYNPSLWGSQGKNFQQLFISHPQPREEK